jgi:hypothetical protein
MPRINSVKKARKAQGKCGRCGKDIAVGDGYIWIKPRYGGKRVRCSDPKCRFRSSDLTGSDKLSRVYSAQEEMEDFIADWDGDEGDVSALKDALEQAASDIREVGEEYQESADNIRDSFSESSTADECEEKAQELEGWADEIESAMDELADFEPDEDETKKADGEPRDSEGRTLHMWREAMIEAAEGPMSSCPV